MANRCTTNNDYVMAREALIPVAEAYAYRVAGHKPVGDVDITDVWADKWNLAFHKKMEDLVRDTGIL